MKKSKFKPYRRLLHINNEVWTYEITRKSICICSPDLQSRAFPDYSEITLLSQDTVERGMWKRWLHVTPALVKSYIMDNFSEWKSTPIQTIWRNIQSKKRENWNRMHNSKELIKALERVRTQ